MKNRKIDVLIVEDEKLASDHHSMLIQSVDIVPINIVGKVDSVKNAMKWWLKNNHPDLFFMDVDLSDGRCCERVEVVDIKKPIICTTAYEEYAIQSPRGEKVGARSSDSVASQGSGAAPLSREKEYKS